MENDMYIKVKNFVRNLYWLENYAITILNRK